MAENGTPDLSKKEGECSAAAKPISGVFQPWHNDSEPSS